MSDSEPRRLVLEALYQAELRKDEHPARRLRGRAKRYAQGVAQHMGELDGRIEAVSRGWSVRRMAVVDRSILRLALYELIYEPTPTAVVIDEAVEMAKRYSTRGSGAFVNGILSTLADHVRSGGPSAE